jgi:4-amino-4-deoxy-L-arabinose transferase-like glycosyltransferase
MWSVVPAVLVIGVCLFSGLNALGLVGPDEPRYAAIARAMAETRDWVTPRLWGTPWFEKPILYYWAAATSIRLFGVSEFSLRLPSALAGLLAVAAAAWTALRSYGMRTACYALLMLPATVAMIAFARAATPDMLFAAFLTAALAAAIEILQKPRPGTLARILFGVFLGAGVLAKGCCFGLRFPGAGARRCVFCTRSSLLRPAPRPCRGTLCVRFATRTSRAFSSGSIISNAISHPSSSTASRSGFSGTSCLSL